MLVLLCLECPFLEMVLVTYTLAQLAVSDQNLLLLAIDEVLFVTDLLVCLIAFSSALVVYLFLIGQVFFEVQEVSHFDTIINWDLEAVHCLVQDFGDPEVDVLVACVDHQKVEISQIDFFL
jgi:hypothetical protein